MALEPPESAMPGPINQHNATPPAAVAPAEPGGSLAPARDAHLSIGPHSSVDLRGLRFDSTTGDGSLGAIGADFRRRVFEATRTPTIGFLDPDSQARGSFAQQLGLSTPQSTWLEKTLIDLGVREANAVAVFRPGQEQGALFAVSDSFQQSLHLKPTGLTYSVTGDSIRDLNRWFTESGAELSSVTVWTDGRRYDVTPSYTLRTAIPGVTATLSTNVSNILSMTDGVNPQFDHALSGDPSDPDAGMLVQGERLLINSYQLASNPGASMTRVDFVGDQRYVSLFLGSDIGGYNFLGFRGAGGLQDGAQVTADVLYTQHFDGGSGIAGALGIKRQEDLDRISYELKLEGYQRFNRAQGSYDPAILPVLGQPESSGDYGIQLFFERRR